MSRREYFSYDGTTFIGRITTDEKTGKAKAFNAAGRSLGKFAGYDAARKAVSEAYLDVTARKASTAEALKRLAEPVGFVSGLPSHFLSGVGTPR